MAHLQRPPALLARARPAVTHSGLLLGPEEEEMDTENRYEELGSFAAKLINRRAAQLAKVEGFNESDREDIEQDLALEVFRRIQDYDPERGKYESFIARIIDHAAYAMIGRRRAAKRDPAREECSLNEMIRDGDGFLVERAETMDHDTYAGRTGSPPEQELQDLRLDLQEVLGSLPPKLRRICDLLAEGRNLPEIARLTGIPQRTIYRARDKIREHFERAGLSDYVGERCGKIRELPSK